MVALRVATAVVVPLVVLIHAFGYYAARAGMWGHLYGRLGLAPDAVSVLLASGTVLTLAGTGAAVLVGALLGPLPTMALGLGLYALGAAGQALAPETASFGAALSLSSFGAGMYRPAMLVACLRPFGAGWESARTGVLLLAYGAANLGALPSGFLSGFVVDRVGAAPMMLFSCVLSGLAAVVCLALFGGSWFVEAEPEPEPEAGPLVVAGVVTVAGGLGFAAWTFGVDLQWEALAREPWLYQVNPVVVVLTTTLGALGCFGAQFAGVRVPAMALAGVGLLSCAVGLAATPAFAVVGIAAMLPALVVGALGEAFVLSPLVAQAAGGLHFRVAILPAAVLVGASSFTSLLGRGMDAAGVSGWIGGIGAVGMAAACALVGIGLVVAGVLPREPDSAVPR